MNALTLGAEPTRPRDDWEWGENRCVDAVVLATVDGRRHLLLIRRGDCGAWALPGGWMEAGESATVAAARELAEETGLRVPHACGIPQRPRLVDDPRCTPWAWIVTTPVVWDLGTVESLPGVEAGDDAADAAWMPAATYGELLAHTDPGAQLYGAHQEMLRDLLG